MKRQQLALESQTEREIQDSARSKVKHLSREDLDRLVNSNVTKQERSWPPNPNPDLTPTLTRTLALTLTQALT